VILRSATVVLALAGSAIVLGAAPRQDPKTEVAKDDIVAVGVACGDGTFAPLASRAKGVWRSLSEPQENIPYFFGLMTTHALRLPRQGWTLHPSSDGKSRPLSLEPMRRKDVSDGSECFDMQGFKSNGLRLRRARCAGCGPTAAVVGIGVLGPAGFELRDDVTAQPDEISRRVAARIVRNVHAVERRVLGESQEKSPLERFAGREEVRSVVRLMTMTRHRADDGEWYFFQARKQYGEWYVFEGKRMYKDWARLLVHGWVRSSSDGLSVHGLTGRFVDDDWKVSKVYRMTGVLVLSDRTVWIAEGVGYESQWYELFERGPGDASPHSVLQVMVHAA
jgi:hypothetical protein